MDHKYSMARRIWRILYPPLILIAIQIVTFSAVSIAVGIFAVIEKNTGGVAIPDAEELIENAYLVINERILLILLISNIVSLIPGIPMWMRARSHNEPYKNDSHFVICLLVIGFFAAFNIIQMMLFALTDIIRYVPTYEDVTSVMMTDSLLVRILAIGIAAPVIEELVYRGVLISRMKWLPAWGAILIQAIIFGAAHMNLFQGVYAFVAGLLLGLVYVKFRSIFAVILGHMAYNLTSVFLDEFVSDSVAGVIVALSVIVLPFCAVLLIKHRKARKLLTEQDIMYTPIHEPVDPWTVYTSMETWKKDDSEP